MIKNLLFISLAVASLPATGQDSHYWNSEYSTAGFFTPGAVISYNGDSGVVFFNPALLANVKKTAASISGNLYRLQTTRIRNAVGAGANLNSTNAGIVPLLVSGTKYMKGKRPLTIGYALVHNSPMQFSANQQKEGQFEVLQDYYSPGKEIFLAQYTLQSSLSTTAAIISSGIRISPTWSVGVAVEGDIVIRQVDSDFSARAFINSSAPSIFPAFVNVQEYYAASYTNVGARMKLGLAYDNNRHHFGLLLTSPVIKGYGRGSVLADFIIARLKIAPSQPDINLLANSRQTKLKTKFKTPISIALGYTYDFNNGQVYAAMEYFTAIKEYNIITPKDDYFVKGDSSSNLYGPTLIKLKDARNSILNAGIGVNWIVRKNIMAFLSARSDFSYSKPSMYKDDDGYMEPLSDWNIVHCQIGLNIKRKAYHLRPGLIFSYGGTSQLTQPLNFDSPGESNVLAGNKGKTSARYLSMGLLLSYIHNF